MTPRGIFSSPGHWGRDSKNVDLFVYMDLGVYCGVPVASAFQVLLQLFGSFCIVFIVQYVGETENALHIRMNGHRSDIRTRKTEKPVATHFCQPDHSLEDLEVRGIEKIHNNSTQWRRERESFWIFTLRTLTPDGMNLDE